MAKRPKWTGGAKLRRFVRESKTAARRAPVIEVGFKDRRMSVLAANLEFGNPKTSLPERPAFRLGVREMAEAVSARIVEMKRQDARGARPEVFGLTDAQAREIAILARDVIRRSYIDFHGAPLSERQKARKAGTEYADEQLIGAEGPKLIQHIKAFVNGTEVS